MYFPSQQLFTFLLPLSSFKSYYSDLPRRGATVGKLLVHLHYLH